jgi:hypothetical protein
LPTSVSQIPANGTVTPATPFVVTVGGAGTYTFQVSGNNTGATGTISVQASNDGVTYYGTTYVSMASGASAGSFSGNVMGQINTAGIKYIQFNPGGSFAGTATFTGNLTSAVSNVMLDNSLPAGTNTIGNVGVPTGVPGYGTTPTETNPTVANNTSTTILAAGTRKGFGIQNNTAANIMISLSGATLTGIVPTASNIGIVLYPGQLYEPPSNDVSQSNITAYQSSGATTNQIYVRVS